MRRVVDPSENSFRLHSITTRIKTRLERDRCGSPYSSGYIPLHQGLRLERGCSVYLLRPSGYIPLQQGLRLLSHRRWCTFCASGYIPLQQGLRLLTSSGQIIYNTFRLHSITTRIKTQQAIIYRLQATSSGYIPLQQGLRQRFFILCTRN